MRAGRDLVDVVALTIRFKRCFQGVPPECGAFQTLREFLDASQGLEISQLDLWFNILRKKINERWWNRQGCDGCFSFYLSCHQRCGCHANRTRLAGELDLFDRPVRLL